MSLARTALVLAFGMMDSSALAQPRRPPEGGDQVDAQLREAARLHFEQGVRHASEGRWGVAILELEQARDLRPTPAVFFNLGMAYREAGRVTEAIAALETFLASPGTPVEPMRVSLTAATLDALRARFAHITLDLSPSEATATLDERPMRDSRSATVNPGTHTLRVQAQGYETDSRSLDLVVGQTLPLVIRLTPRVERGRLELDCSVPGATLEVDGARVGASRAQVDLIAGTHRVVVRAAGYLPMDRVIEIRSGGRMAIHATLRERSGSVLASPWFWVGASALIAVGVVAGVLLFPTSTQAPIDGALGHVSNAVTSP